MRQWSTLRDMKPTVVTTASSSVSRVLCNTYLLLTATLIWTTVTALFAMAHNVQPLGIIPTLFVFLVLPMLTVRLRNSPWGLLTIFLFTGACGYLLGPILNMFLHQYVNGAQLITSSLATTALIFCGLSGYVLVTKKDFSFMAGVTTILLLTAIVMAVGAMIFHWPMMQILVSGLFAVLYAGFIMITTSQIIHGGETNYLMATISLYISIFNLFIALLNILSFFGGNRN